MDTTKKSQAVLSLCSGYGGIERGLNLAGVEHRVVTYVEIEAYAIANLVSKMESGQLDAAPVWTDLKTLPVEPFRRRVDIITGGYPCSPFSVAGKRGAEKDERHLWPYIREIIRAVRPVRCFFENVEGHINLGLREVISDLESLGYKTAWGIFSAAEVGAPHQRKRTFVLARRQNEVPPVTADESEIGSLGEIGEQATQELADSCRQRLQGEKWRGEASEERTSCGHIAERCGRVADFKFCWPSRPGEPQFHWEDPRVVPQLDGAVNGTSGGVDTTTSRVERLTLIGNGVCPATAAQAFRVLSKELNR